MNSGKLIVALDVPTLSDAEKLVRSLSPFVHTFKIGKELFTSCGPEVVRMVRSQGADIFLDLKFHDIPNTVSSACRAAVRQGVFMLNVHCLGGRKMMTEAAAAVHEEAAVSGKKPLLIGVTLLTSMGDADLGEIGIAKKTQDEVRDLAALAFSSGLDGVVASGQEIELIRKVTNEKFIIVTPGVRPAWAAQGDQKRVVTPKEAVDKGASFIIVGRPITHHPRPEEAAQMVLKEIAG